MKHALHTLIIAVMVAATGCVTVPYQDPLSGCERLALDYHRRLTKEGKDSYMALIKYRNRLGGHAVVAEVMPSGKFHYYDPALGRYLDRDEFRLKWIDTDEWGMYKCY